MWLMAHRLAQAYTELSFGRSIHESSFGSFHRLLEEDASYRVSEEFEQDRRFWIDCLAGEPGAARFKEQISGSGNDFIRRTLELPNSTADEIRSLRFSARVHDCPI